MTSDPVAELYSSPLEEFTERRNSLAKQMKDAGRADEAARLKDLRKPKLSAWAVNQLVHGEGGKLDELFAVTDEAATASDAKELRDIGSRRQKLIRALSDIASRRLVYAGHSASANTMQEVVQTLQATAEPEARAAVLRGDLVEPLAPTGFSFGLDLGDVSEPEEEPIDREAERRAREIEELTRQLKEAKKAARDKRLAADRERARAERSEADAAKAERDAERIEEKLIDLKGQTA